MLDRQLSGNATPDDRVDRRFYYIDAALEPIADRLAPAEFDRVRHALAFTMGSQVVSALLDTCGLDVDEARDVTAFASRAIVAEAMRMAGVEHRGPEELIERVRRSGVGGRVPISPRAAAGRPQNPQPR